MEYKKVEYQDVLTECIGNPSGEHRWTHDGILWAMPGQPEEEWPYLWQCGYCHTTIRTRMVIPGFEFPDEETE